MFLLPGFWFHHSELIKELMRQNVSEITQRGLHLKKSKDVLVKESLVPDPRSGFWGHSTGCAEVRGDGSSGTIQQLSEGPLDVDSVSKSGDAQLHVVLFGEGGEMGPFDLVLLEALAVFGQAHALQPVAHVVFIPQAEGSLPPWPES